MDEPFDGIERRLEKLAECLNKLEPLTERSRNDFRDDPYLCDIVERNLEVSAQAIIDIANRIISYEQATRPTDYYEAIESLGQLGVLDADFAEELAPMAGFRNVLVDEYVDIDWDIVYDVLQNLDDLRQVEQAVADWLKARDTD